MKKTTSFMLCVLILICMFTGCSGKQNADGNASIQALAPVDETVSMHTFSQKAFLNGPDSLIGMYAYGQEEKSRPKPIEFEWEYNGTDHTQFTLNISEKEDMTNAVSYNTDQTEYAVYNLKIGTDYYWTVSTENATSDV